MPIIGQGLLAREFKKNSIRDDILIIAAGVSNSQETRNKEFNREELLIKEILLNNKMSKVVYLSTCSIFQLEKTPYIKHKIKMEKIFLATDKCYIFRLPQVVGVVNNNTLISYLVRNMYLNKDILIQENAFRNLIDVEDVVRIVKSVVESDITVQGNIINIASSSYISVMDIASKIKSILSSNSKLLTIPGGEKYNIDTTFIKSHVGENDNIFSEFYTMHVIEKYVKKIKQQFSREWDML